MPKLILMFKNKVLNAYPLNEGDILAVGRHSDNDIIIDNLAVSGHHARIEHRHGVIQLTDLKSKNGTFCNGAAITECVLYDRDTVIIGKHMLQADFSDTITVFPGASSHEPQPAPLNAARTMVLESTPEDPCAVDETAFMPAKARPAADCLTFLSGGQGEYSLCKHQISIGSNADADIVISGAWALLMGGPAAVISKRAGDYLLRFAGGWIKPKRNGARIRGMVKLNHEDIVAVGPVKMQVHLSDRSAAQT